jgi:hypothetical protein
MKLGLSVKGQPEMDSMGQNYKRDNRYAHKIFKIYVPFSRPYWNAVYLKTIWK